VQCLCISYNLNFVIHDLLQRAFLKQFLHIKPTFSCTQRTFT
jgi:hypothetical protein